MRVLLDEDVPVRLRFHFREDVTVETVQYRGWKGLKNGALLRAAEGDFDVLVTMDDKLPDQQNLRQFDIAVAVFRATSKRLRCRAFAAGVRTKAIRTQVRRGHSNISSAD